MGIGDDESNPRQDAKPDSNGTKVQLWDCNGSNQQKWRFHRDGTIRSAYNGWCLDSDLNTINRNGTYVQLWDCKGQPQQQWWQ